MDIIKRIFIVIWLFIYVIFCFLGGGFVIPILYYIIKGEFEDPMITIMDTHERGRKLIESFFDNIKKYTYKNGQFWK